MRQVVGTAIVSVIALGAFGQGEDAYLSWTPKQAETVGKSMYGTGQVGGGFDLRIIRTDRSYNYKLAATWLTPDVIRATVRLQQLAGRFNEQEARSQVTDAVSYSETVFIVEIDPREGSGVIPDDWLALLEPRAGKDKAFPVIAGTKAPERRSQGPFQGVRRRDYAYDRFWVAFPLVKDGLSTIPPEATELRLVVRIYEKEGRVTWPITAALRTSLRME